MKSKPTYIALAIVFVASAAAAILLPLGEMIRTVAAIPAIGSLCGALLVISRDRIAYERSLRLLETQNSFAMGATSHMANVAFDKHVSFCEEYAAEMFGALNTLFRRGPHRDALQHADSLFNIRRTWTVWLTPEIEAKLVQFEGAIRTIGAQAGLLDDVQDVPDRAETVRTTFATFAEVIGLKEWQGEPITGDRAVEKVLHELQRVLGIDELTLLRSELVKRALVNLKDSG